MPPSRRDDVIDAAVAVFSRHGFHGTGLDMVLAEGGVSRMTLYNHFKSKDDLIVAAIERHARCFADKLTAHVDTAATTPTDRLLAVFDFFGAWIGCDSFHGCMFIHAAGEYEDPTGGIRRAAAQAKRWVLDYLTRQAKAAGLVEPDALALSLLMLLEGAVVTARILGQCPDDPVCCGDPARRARAAAATLIDSHRAR